MGFQPAGASRSTNRHSAPYAWSQQPRPAQLELGLPLAVVEKHLLPSGLNGDLGARAQAIPQVRSQHVVHLN